MACAADMHSYRRDSCSYRHGLHSWSIPGLQPSHQRVLLQSIPSTHTHAHQTYSCASRTPLLMRVHIHTRNTHKCNTHIQCTHTLHTHTYRPPFCNADDNNCLNLPVTSATVPIVSFRVEAQDFSGPNSLSYEFGFIEINEDGEEVQKVGACGCLVL